MIHVVVKKRICQCRKLILPHLQAFCFEPFILKLDVCQLVFQLGWVGSSDHLVCRCKSQFKYKVIVKSLRIKNAMVGHDLMVEIYAILAAVNFVHFFFDIDA